MKVLMLPILKSFKGRESGIKRVIEAYHRYGSDFGIDFVKPGAGHDLSVIHAGASTEPCDVAMLHGMYWTADYAASEAEYQTNARIVASLRTAKEITVPSNWVAETFRRELRVDPWIIPHGIEVDEWQHDEEDGGYILWNKNRTGVDVCNPGAVGVLAERFPDHLFLSTFAEREDLPNVKTLGLIPHADMKVVVQRAHIYLSTVKETFGIGVLEAMASGVPVLGWAEGGNLDLVQHGINGYLARPGDWDDLEAGFAYCHQHRATLGANGRELVKEWTWAKTMEKLVACFERAAQPDHTGPLVGVVIPCHNKQDTIARSIQSVRDQTLTDFCCVVVNDASTDGSEARILEAIGDDERFRYEAVDYHNVADTRNHGIARLDSRYTCPLDGDDWIEPDFLRVCVNKLETESTLGITYSGMRWHRPDGTQGTGRWPGRAEADRQAKGFNQVPTCCVFRRVAWQRLGGYRSRYAPTGAGSEDAELWLRMMAYGYQADEATPEPLFNYSWLSGQVSGDPNYREVNWLFWHPWAKDKQYPFSAVMQPMQHVSHDVRQYDRPAVSVIIPVGPGHEGMVIDALDSLEAQAYRNWEAVVVWDCPDEPPDWMRIAYPYVKWIIAPGKGGHGAGWARNRGAEEARADFLFWLDADDYLHPRALARFLGAWNKEQQVIYSDVIGRIRPVRHEEREALRHSQQFKKMVRWDAGTEEAWVAYRAYDFDCERALKQPEEPVPYYWCYVSCLVPKAWHDEIGGFDENMESWEDADYAYRMVRAGHCYTRLLDEMVLIRFYTGMRLRRGLQIHQNLVKYLKAKYRKAGGEPVCGCKGKRVTVPRSAATAQSQKGVITMSDEDMVLVRFNGKPPGNRGKVMVYGSVMNPETGKKFFYGRRSAGEQIYVHRDEIWQKDRFGNTVRTSKLFEPLQQKVTEVKPVPKARAVPSARAAPDTTLTPVAEPVPLKDTNGNSTFDLQKIPGVGASIARQLRQAGLDTPDAILNAGTDKLATIRGISDSRASLIVKYLDSQ